MKEKINNLLARYRQFKYHLPLPILVLLIVLVVGIILITFALIQTNSSPSQNQPFDITSPTKSPQQFQNEPTPTINPSITPAFTRKQDKINSSVNEQPLLEKDHLVSVFIDSLPYQGSDVKVTYTISDNVVHVVINKSNQALGNQEFDALLKKYNIQSRAWIPSLQISTK